MIDKFPSFKEKIDKNIHITKYKICIIYASKNTVAQDHKKNVDCVTYFDYSILKYFHSVTGAVKLSARNELLNFLGFSKEDIEGQVLSDTTLYKGSILPEAHSNFAAGYKVVSFYVDPASLLSRSYVLRKDGWMERDGLYQRMIAKGKIEAIRTHLRKKQRVFINNIIVTLPSETRILDERKNTKDINKINNTEPVNIQLPNEFNSVGIIDGQHRVFAYHEGGSGDDKIKSLRERQNLLVTGIIYPDDIKKLDKIKFEAKLFLEINSTQTNAKSDLKQAIHLLLSPFKPVSIGKKVIHRLNEKGPLLDQIERHFYDKDKIKTTSIVSYALVPLVKLQGDDSLFKLWSEPGKDRLTDDQDEDVLNRYIDYCVEEINNFLVAIRSVLPNDRWTPVKKVKGRYLTTTIINGFFICLRKLVENEQTGTIEDYKAKLVNLENFKFDAYHSSQYARMANDLYETFFLKEE